MDNVNVVKLHLTKLMGTYTNFNEVFEDNNKLSILFIHSRVMVLLDDHIPTTYDTDDIILSIDSLISEMKTMIDNNKLNGGLW